MDMDNTRARGGGHGQRRHESGRERDAAGRGVGACTTSLSVSPHGCVTSASHASVPSLLWLPAGCRRRVAQLHAPANNKNKQRPQPNDVLDINLSRTATSYSESVVLG
jgi:hypothetical protein